MSGMSRTSGSSSFFPPRAAGEEDDDDPPSCMAGVATSFATTVGEDAEADEEEELDGPEAVTTGTAEAEEEEDDELEELPKAVSSSFDSLRPAALIRSIWSCFSFSLRFAMLFLID